MNLEKLQQMMVYIQTYHYICCGIGAYINDSIVRQNIILISRVSKHHYDHNKKITKY
jgi:hypothetical protein